MKQPGEEDYRSSTDNGPQPAQTCTLLLTPPPATKHPSTLQSSASELPQVDSCALLPSLSFWGSAKSDCLGRKSSNEAQLCRSSSAETQIPADVNEASGRMLMPAFCFYHGSSAQTSIHRCVLKKKNDSNLQVFEHLVHRLSVS